MTGAGDGPEIFRPDDPAVTRGPQASLPVAADLMEPGADAPPPPRPPLRLRAWRWLLGALASLVMMAIGFQVWSLVEALLARFPWAGWLAAGLAGVAAAALVAIAVSEIAAFARARKVDGLRAQVAAAALDGEDAATRAAAQALRAFYADRPDAAWGCARHDERAAHVTDGADLLELAERELLGPLDARAAEIASGAARTTALVTAVSALAFLDAAVALFSSARAVRGIAEVYGGRPGLFGALGLARKVIVHLGATGAIALGDEALQQVMGHGLAARLSRRFGEGMVNGALTARVAIAAMAVCRPAPFRALEPPRLTAVMGRAMGALRARAGAGEDPTLRPG